MRVRLSFALAATAAALALAGPASAATVPSQDPFYEPAAGYEASAPGTVLRSRPANVAALGIALPIFKAHQVLYRSTDAKGAPTATAATIILPATPAPPGGRNLVSYQTAEDALSTKCAPSYRIQQGTEKEEPQFLLPALLHGDAVVVPDYEGPDSQWAAALQAGHAVLDGIRAAENFAPAGLSPNTKVGLWGYSGGGQATASASELQASYAPELNIKGAAHGGSPADIPTSVANLDGGPFSGIIIGATIGLSRAYPELETLLNDAGRAMRDEIGEMCIEEFAVALPFKRLASYTTSPDPLNIPFVKAIIEENNLGHHAPTHPVYLYHGILDELNPISEGDGLFAKYCAGGTHGEVPPGAARRAHHAGDYRDVCGDSVPGRSVCREAGAA